MNDLYRTEQQRATDGVLVDVVEAISRVGRSYADLSQRQRADFDRAMQEIASLRADLDRGARGSAKRFMALAGEYGRADGRVHRGVFPTREAARQAGLLVIASQAAAGPEARAAAMAELHKAGVAPSPGGAGGYLMPEQLIPGIVRNVEEAGVWERNCPPLTVTQHTGAVVIRRGGLTISFPDYEEASEASEPLFGRANYSLRRWATLALVDRWMLSADLAVALAEFVVMEAAYAIALAQDTLWFVGDGTSPGARYLGLMNDDEVSSFTPVPDYDEFSEVIAVSSECLGGLLGQCPAYVTRHPQAKWYMHASIFWGYMSVRDAAGMPIAAIYLKTDGPHMYLMGYPVEWTQVMPAVGSADDGASKPMLAFGALPLAYRTFRKTNGIEVRTSEHFRFPEGLVAIAVDVLQDRVLVDGNGVCRLITHS